jgi:hypothetical protein
VRFNQSDIEVVSRIDKPVDAQIVQQLMQFDDFRSAYSGNGLTLEPFNSFPPTVRILRQFVAACHELEAQIRELMLPNPDDQLAARVA